MSNVEIVVVGAGVAGLSAALAVAGTGHDVTLVTKTELVESNTYHAQGGIAAASSPTTTRSCTRPIPWRQVTVSPGMATSYRSFTVCSTTAQNKSSFPLYRLYSAPVVTPAPHKWP